MDPLLNQTLSNFRIERLLAHGGMASVYLGKDIKLHRPVAIKVIDARYKDNPDYVKRFLNEARLMAKWRYENIVQIHYADDKPVLYFVMEYVDGYDLASIMSQYSQRGELMPVRDVLRIGKVVAGALDYAHKQGVIHRDVKPSNVLIASDGRVVLSDFGMALEIRDGSMGNIFGTPHYISPEQARRSADAVPQSDIYSLGVILYEMLTGVVPFDDTSPASVALAHISANPPLPRTLNAEITPATEKVLMKALSKDINSRYQSGAKLMEAIESALTAKPSASQLDLPPLPVGVPTIRHSDTSISALTRRGFLKSEERAKAVSLAPTALAETPKTKRGRTGLYAGIAILLLLIGGWFTLQRFSANGFFASAPIDESPTPLPATSTLVQPTQTESQPTPIPTETLTSIPLVFIPPSETATLLPLTEGTAVTTTALESETPTSLPSPTVPAPFTETVTPVLPIATVLYPDGNHFTLFYNESSLHLLNRSRTIRGVTGFHFERINLQGGIEEKFDGYLWEKMAANILPKYCVSIKIFDSLIPYIDPPDCKGSFLSFVQPKQDEDRAMIFWSPKPNSTQFRVLWKDEEIARCEISAGVCELYVP
jgi:serine/threonine protein kinase